MKKWPACLLCCMILLFLILLVTPLAIAQEQKEQQEAEVKLKQVVVTATRSAKCVDEVTADVEVVTQDEIKSAAAANVDDVLRRLAGVDIRRPSDFGITSPLSVNIRGVGGTKRILFMADGVPLNSAITGIIQPNRLQLSSIERVEVVKGPFSSLYGSNAMGGVINVVSKKREADGFDITPSFKAGNFGMYESGISLLGRKGKFSYSLDGSYREIDNHYRRDQNVSYSYNRTTGTFDKVYEDVDNNSEYDDSRFFTRLNYDISDETGISFTANYVEANSGMAQTSYIEEPKDIDTERTYHFFNLSGHTRVLGNMDIDLRVYTNYNKNFSNREHILDNPEYESTSDSSMSGMSSMMMGDTGGVSPYLYVYGDLDYWGRDTGVQFKGSVPVGKYNYFTFGIDSNFMDAYWENSDEHGETIGDEMDESLDNHAIYLQDEIELFSSFIVTLGMRYDINSQSDNSFSPKLGLLYNLNERVSFRSSVGRAFRAPNLNELYTPTWMMVKGIPFESNPDLEPEIIWSYDLGTSIRLTDTINFNLTGFYSNAKDLISNPIENGVMRYENLDEVETDGFEIGFDGQVLPWLNAYINYTYTHSVDTEEGRLADMPLHQANAGIRTKHDLFSKFILTTCLDARYNGSMYYTDRMTSKTIDIDEFTVLDFSARLEVSERFGINAAVSNITDEDYEIHGSNLGPETCYWAGIDYKF